MKTEPQMNADEPGLNGLTEKIIGCAFRVSNQLGCGFLEKCYENAMAIELAKSGLKFSQQAGVKVMYDGVVVGEYVADIIVEGLVLLELKAVKALDAVHMAQCLNYLRATRLPVCLLMNFARPRLEIKRFRNEQTPAGVRSSIFDYPRSSAFISGSNE